MTTIDLNRWHSLPLGLALLVAVSVHVGAADEEAISPSSQQQATMDIVELRPFLVMLDTNDRLHDGRFGSTESRDGWRTGLRLQTAGSIAAPSLQFLAGMAWSYERREMYGVVNPKTRYGYLIEGDLTWLMLLGAWTPPPSFVQSIWLAGPRYETHHLNALDWEMSVGLRWRFGPKRCCEMEARGFGSAALGTLGGAMYSGTRYGACVDLGWWFRPHYRLGLEVGYSGRKGSAAPNSSIDANGPDWEANYRGSALEVGLTFSFRR